MSQKWSSFYYGFENYTGQVGPSTSLGGISHRAHRVATAIFWRTFHHDWKNKPRLAARVQGGVQAHPPFTISTITYKVVVYAPRLRGHAEPVLLNV